ncbi:TIGR03086 family metal-binding protein [Actinopolyspora mortivallis]|uniref:TIGR03086 family metal-binding protein n=1 Tax=Actinopolyspora mortivallis TaxID=33906 RepID=UPI0003681DC0|nr:TIGR03086 family metal-binding protein [Actinopolyspora mortivallis]
MELLPAHRLAMREFDRRVRQTTVDQLDNPTPCSEWNVRDLLNHLISEQLWAPWLLEGHTLAQVGDRFDGDHVGRNPRQAWEKASSAARAAWDAASLDGRVHVTGGTIPTEEYGWQMTMDLAVHAWDLATGIHADTRLDPELVEAVYAVFEPQREALRHAGVFAAPEQLPDTADQQSRLLALVGRRP